MARIRTIKPEFPQSESMGRVSRDARLLFIQVWTICDDAGRCRGASSLLRGLLYPYDDLACSEIDKWLAELDRVGSIVLYEIDGWRYLQVQNWARHQRIDKPSGPKLPEFVEGSRVLPEASRGLPVGSGPGPGPGPRPGPGRGKEGNGEGNPKNRHSRGTDEAVVFEHYKTVWQKPKAKLDPKSKRRAMIRKALKTFTVAEICECISGYRNSPHHCGQNSQHTVYDNLSLFLRDDEHIEAGLRFAKGAPNGKPSPAPMTDADREKLAKFVESRRDSAHDADEIIRATPEQWRKEGWEQFIKSTYANHSQTLQ